MYNSIKRSTLDISKKDIDISKYSRAIESEPKNPRAYFLRGATYHSLAHFRLAKNDYTKALELNPDNKSFNYEDNLNSDFKTFTNNSIKRNLNGIKNKTGRKYEQVIIDFSREIETDPTDPRAYYLRGYYFAKLLHYKLSIDDLTIALNLNPSNKKLKLHYSPEEIDNVTILQVRSRIKKLNKDKIGAIEDLELSRQLLEKNL